MPPETASTTGSQVFHKATLGLFWNFLAYALSKGIVLVTTSILARLLAKSDFGVVALALVAINYLAVVKDLGLGMALIQQREGVEEAAHTVFTVNVVLGFVLSTLLFPLAPYIAAYFREPTATPVIRWLGLSFLISSLGSMHVIWLMRQLNYRQKMIPDLGSALVKGVVSIGLALAGMGVWALVWGQLVGAIVSVSLYWLVSPWRPRLTIHLPTLKNLLRFGTLLTLDDLLTVSIDNLGYLIIGKLFGMALLGTFTLAYRLPEMLLLSNLWVTASVTFPAFARVQGEQNELRRGFLASVKLVQLFAVPICLGLIITADPIVRVLFGAQWLDAIPVLRVLALYALVISLGYHIGDVYKAIGRPDILLKLSILTLALMVVFVLGGARFGLLGVAWGYVLAALIDRLVGLRLAARFVKVSPLDIFREMLPALHGGLLLVIVALPVLYATAPLPPFLRLTLVALSGAIAYLVVLWKSERQSLLKLLNLMRTPAEA